MEEEDYKEIAKIIKNQKKTNYRFDDIDRPKLIKSLANSFELSSGYNFMPHEKVFNKKQFLKDAGLKSE